MLYHVRGHTQSGEPIETEIEIGERLHLGDSLKVGSTGQRVQIVKIHQSVIPGKSYDATITVEPMPDPESIRPSGAESGVN
jgi:hypothetical protein